MPDRALIIAVENYDAAAPGFLAKQLPGTVQAAQEFRTWLETKWKAEQLTGTVLFCSEPRVPGGTGASSDDVIDALITLERTGLNTTDNLYVYFSGHGFRASGETIRLADVIVCSNFVDVERSAHTCFKLDALIDGLRKSLGPGCHYYFIDACRNEVPKGTAFAIKRFNELGTEEPSVFVLQSTVAGAPALVAGPFAQTLRLGLQGFGRAKVWDPQKPDSMKVTVNSLRLFLKKELDKTQPIALTPSGDKETTEAVIATIKPVVPSKLTIIVETTETIFSGAATIGVVGAPPTRRTIAGLSNVIELPPNDYRFGLSSANANLTPQGIVDVDLYEDREVRYQATVRLRKGPAGPEVTEPPRPNVGFSIPLGAELRMVHVNTGLDHLFDDSSAEASLPVGIYRATLRQKGGHVIAIKDVTIGAEERTEIAPASWSDNAAQKSLAQHFPRRDGGIDFSKALQHPIADPDLNVWLAIVGAGRILGSQGLYSKIGKLPLKSFADEQPGSSPIYILAGFPSRELRTTVGIGNGKTVEWVAMQEPNDMAGVRQAAMHPQSGQWFVTLAIGDQPAYTVASVAISNRCTLIVAALDEDGQPMVDQYLLPIGHLTSHLDPYVQETLRLRYYQSSNHNQLKDVYKLALLGRAFRRRRNLADEFKDNDLDELLFCKWLDPIGAALSAYEIARRNRQDRRLPIVARNMQKFFADLPDAVAIARLAGQVDAPPNGVPLFIDGLRAFKDYETLLPFAAELLDFSGPWTAWRGAVPL